MRIRTNQPRPLALPAEVKMPMISPQTVAVVGGAAVAAFYWNWARMRAKSLPEERGVVNRNPGPARYGNMPSGSTASGEDQGFRYDQTTDAKKLKARSASDTSGGAF